MKIFVPLLIPFLGLISGILLSFGGANIWISLCSFVFGILIYFFLLVFSKKPSLAYRINSYHNIWIYFVFLSIGIFSTEIKKPAMIENEDNFILCKGKIIDIQQSTSGDNLVLDINGLIDRKGNFHSFTNLKILLKSDAVLLNVDDNVLAKILLERIKDSENYFSSGYSKSLERKGILYQSSTHSSDISILSHNLSLNGLAYKIREKIESKIENLNINKQTQNFLISILLGDKRYFSRTTRDIFADAGISHILALSGMHIAVIGSFVLWCLFPLNFFGKYKLRWIFALIILFLYTFITGMAFSTVRAYLMLCAVMLSFILERKNMAWNSLLLATFIILIFDPYAIKDIGLQLSFISMASLIFLVNPFIPFNRHEHHYLYAISSFILITLVATVATWCLTAYYFGIIPLAFFPLNLLIVPLLPFYLIIASIYILLNLSGVSVDFLGMILDKGYNALISLVSFFTDNGNSSLNFKPSLITVIIWFAIILLIISAVNKKKKHIHKRVGFFLIVVFITSIVITSDAENRDGFIIQKGIRNVNILSRTNGKEKIHKFENNTISEITIANHNIIVITGFTSNGKNHEVKYCDELVIANGCTDKIEEITDNFKCNLIIIHPSIRKKKEADIIHKLDSIGLKYHSIRFKGAYKHL